MMQKAQQPVTIRIDQTLPIYCSHCNGQTFMEALILRRVSKFITASSEDGIQPIPTMVCTQCGKPLEELLPAALKGESNEADS